MRYTLNDLRFRGRSLITTLVNWSIVRTLRGPGLLRTRSFARLALLLRMPIGTLPGRTLTFQCKANSFYLTRLTSLTPFTCVTP